MVTFTGSITFMVFIVVLCNQSGQTSSSGDQDDLERASSSNSQRVEETKNQSQPSSSSSPPRTVERQAGNNSFLNLAPHHFDQRNPRRQVPQPHQMDTLSWVSLGYCFMVGIEVNAIDAQVSGDLNPRVITLSILTMLALICLIAANAVFARTNPRLAFFLDRTGSALVLASSLVAACPLIPVGDTLILVELLVGAYVIVAFHSSVAFR